MTAERTAAPAAEKARSGIPKLSLLDDFDGGEERCVALVGFIGVCSDAIHGFWIRSESTICVKRPK